VTLLAIAFLQAPISTCTTTSTIRCGISDRIGLWRLGYRAYGREDLRLSYVTWDEGVNPYVVVELLSPGTEKEDLGQTEAGEGEPPTKWDVYERILKVPYYVLYDRYSNMLRGFHLVEGQYQVMVPENNRFWMPELKIGLGLWQGEYEGRTRPWLRWFDNEGLWIPTPLEQAEAKAARLAEQLRALGIDPDLG
jgi:hypothetical protein